MVQRTAHSLKPRLGGFTKTVGSERKGEFNRAGVRDEEVRSPEHAQPVAQNEFMRTTNTHTEDGGPQQNSRPTLCGLFHYFLTFND